MRIEPVIADSNKEIGVLEIKEHAQVKADAHYKQESPDAFFLLAPDGIGQNKVNHCRKNDQQHKAAAGFIKEIKREKTKDVPSGFELMAKCIVETYK